MENKAISEPTPPEKLGFLELIYGVLLDPLPTLRQVAVQPPVGLTVLIFTLVSVVNVLSSVLVTTGKGNLIFPGLPQTATQAIQALIPVIILLWLVLKYLKWFVCSSVLHLVATLLGSHGNAQGVFAVTGLAILPSLFMVPLNLLLYWMTAPSFTIIITLLSLLIYIWGIILVIFGLREVYNFSTGRSLLVLFLPPIVTIFFVLAALIVLAGCLPSLAPLKPNF
ncbi:hypothetical protein DK28_0201880 [Peptococcaceae bacterium SCADC1_2_3]|jgi:hypothetical protein|nr:hypothetical protein DK28_0201880 [Peptococcaceae bacterium SCADC1_2_3]KFI35906.1 hypothetical protein HY00_10585 [Peptococcaceae bacterium SCADC1_2_3]